MRSSAWDMLSLNHVRHSDTKVLQEVGYLGLEVRESYQLVV